MLRKSRKLIMSGDQGHWSHLAHGTAFLLQARGTDRYGDAFDYTMLVSQMGFVVCTVNSCIISSC